MVAVTSVSAFMLTSSTTSAAPEEKSARIEVRNACSMESEVSNAHTATVSAGSYKDNIGTTVVSVVCNDNAGFAVYAIGFTNDTDGTTTMNGLQGGTIATGLAKQGNTSSWSMKLSTYDNDAYAPTIENDYDDYNVVPDDYIMVASYPAATTVSEPSVFKTSYAAYASMSQAADTYTGQVKYVMVHPSDGEAPEKETAWEPEGGSISDASEMFPANSIDRAMEIKAASSSASIYLKASDDAENYTEWQSGDNIGNNNIYFSMQDFDDQTCTLIPTPANVDDPLPTAKMLDTRDGKVYNIAKLKDGKCWMQDNLALNPITANLTSDNTNATTASIGYLKNGGGTASDKYAMTGVALWTEYSSFSAPEIYVDGYGSAPSGDTLAVAGGWKSGIQYNLCAATAGSFCYGQNTDTAGTPVNRPGTAIDADEDLCPAGWRLPTGGKTSGTNVDPGGGEYLRAFNNYTNGDQSKTSDFRSVLHLPLAGTITPKCLIMMGMKVCNDHGSGSDPESTIYRLEEGTHGYFWSSTAPSDGNMYAMAITATGTSADTMHERNYGGSIRCVAK